MPVKIESMPKIDRGRRSKYDFNALFDGNPYVLVQGTKEEVEKNEADYSCKTDSFRQTVYAAAVEAGHALKTVTTTHGEGDNAREAVAVQVTGPYVKRERKPKAEGGNDQPKGEQKGSQPKQSQKVPA